MIEKQRLEELIEQEATIYFLIGTECYEALVADSIIDNNILKSNTGKHCWLSIDELFETKEQAEWYLKTNITKTVKLPYIPSWEEIKDEEYGFKLLCKCDKLELYLNYEYTEDVQKVQPTVNLQHDEKTITLPMTKHNWNKIVDEFIKIWREQV